MSDKLSEKLRKNISCDLMSEVKDLESENENLKIEQEKEFKKWQRQVIKETAYLELKKEVEDLKHTRFRYKSLCCFLSKLDRSVLPDDDKIHYDKLINQIASSEG